MRCITTLLLLFSLIFLSVPGLAQQSAAGQPTATQENEPCEAGSVPVTIKLRGGGKLEGALIEKTAETISICEKGRTRVVETRNVSQLKTRMTGEQRLKHSLRVIGIFFTVSFIVSYYRYRANT
jgi:hypothetical protein